MAERDLTSARAQLSLCASVSVLLSCGVGNVLLAVTDSLVWPLVLGVAWVVIAAVVTGLAQVAAPTRSRAHPAGHLLASAAAPARPW